MIAMSTLKMKLASILTRKYLLVVCQDVTNFTDVKIVAKF